MAAEASVSDPPLKRSSSFSFIPPNMSELRAVLLGNSWSERSSVGNFLLGKTTFYTDEEPDQGVHLGKQLKDKTLFLVNTPNLLQRNISQKELTRHVELCARFSDPGPHVFLLVIQPEGFTEENSRRLQSFIENFGEQSWSHSVLLISTPEEETPSPLEETFPSLRDLIKKCRVKLLWNKNLQQNLLTSLSGMMEENKGDHVTQDVYRDAHSSLPSGSQSLQQEASTSFNLDPVAGNTHGLRIVLLGKSDVKKTSLGNMITGKQEFKAPYIRESKQCVSVSGEWNRKPFTVVKTPDVFNLSVEAVRKEMKRCVDFCSPGPNVLLLLVKPSEFTEDERKTLMFILSLFGQDVFKHSMVVLTHEEKHHDTVEQLIQDCQQKVHSFTDRRDPSKHEVQQLMPKIEDIASTQRGRFLVVDKETDVVAVQREPRPPVNLVLFGRRGSGKTSAVNAILGQGRFGPAANSSECVRNQGEVCGEWVSVVELPALYGRPQEEVMEKSLRCVSLCDPEGVHAFILVLPVAPLTDEDKGELQTIQKTFSSSVNDFTMILFTEDSDPSSRNFLEENKELQQLCQSLSGKHFVLNIHGRRDLSRLFYNVDTMRRDRDGSYSYTRDMFHHVQIGKIIQQEQNINLLQSELEELKTKNTGSCDEEIQNTECLRIVLLGKTGSGKSSSGNTILGRKEFRAELGGKSVTKQCQKAVGEVDNRTVVVVDTPGLFDDSLSNEEVNGEMVKCVSLLAPGPHVFLLVIRIGRFTLEEKETLKLIRNEFGKNSLHFAFILLTGGDELEKNKQSVEEYVYKCDDSFKSLIADCGGRFHVFNNYEPNPNQVRQLIAKIDTMVKKNGGDCFTNEMLQEAEAAIKKEMEKLLKEKEEEMEREREEVGKRHEEEMQKMMMRMKKQRAELEEERKLVKEQLNEKEENIRKERELRKREQEEREEEDKKKKSQEEVQRREWKQKLEALEKNIKSESDQKETIDKKLVESREEMRKEREIWEEKRKEWWEERDKENEEIRQKERNKLLKLQEEFEQERKEYEIKRKEDDEKKREEEEKKRQEFEENYKKELENMKKKHEDEARQQAEEFNEFKTNKEMEFAALIDEHIKNVTELKKKHLERQQRQKKESEEKEKNLKTQMDEQLDKHKEELTDLTLVVMKQRKENHDKLQKIQTKHRDDMKTLYSDLKKTLAEKITEEIDRLKKVQQNEMEALEKEPQTENKEQRKAEMSIKHEEEIETLRAKVEDKQKLSRKEKMDELQKQHDEEMNEFKKNILKEMQSKQGEEMMLQRQHDEEMNTLYQKVRDGHDVKEFEELREKHKGIMKKLKEELIPKQCTIS